MFIRPFQVIHLCIDHWIDLLFSENHFLAELDTHDLIFLTTITINCYELAINLATSHVFLINHNDTVDGLAIISVITT